MWKKVLVIVIITLIGVALLQGIEVPKVGTEPTTPYHRWKTVATFASVNGDPVDLIDTERTYAIVQNLIETAADDEEKIIIKAIPYGTNAIRFRLSGITEAGLIVLQIYSGSLENQLNCELVKYGTLTFTIGTQETINTTFEFADTCILTNANANASITDWTIASPADNTCAEVFRDFVGDDILVIVPTRIDCNAKLFMKGI